MEKKYKLVSKIIEEKLVPGNIKIKNQKYSPYLKRHHLKIQFIQKNSRFLMISNGR